MSEAIYVRVAPKDINYINRIMEGYEYLGVVTTVKKPEGLLIIRVTPGYLPGSAKYFIAFTNTR